MTSSIYVGHITKQDFLFVIYTVIMASSINNPKPSTMMPSEVAPPTRSDTLPQQAATQPGDGGEVHAHSDGTEMSGTQADRVPFKERVIGAAKKTRGTLLNKPELKQKGEMILEGQTADEGTKAT